jgi:hypothetical protein
MNRARLAFILTLAAAAAVAVVAAILIHQNTTTGAASSSPDSEPPAAAAAIRLLLSPHGRTALTPELSAVLPAGQLFPAGTTFAMASGTWHQSGAYANVTGTISEPGQPRRQAEIGLVLRHGHWLITFETRM